MGKPDRSYVPPDGPSEVEVTITVTGRAGSRSRPEQLAAAVVARPRTTLALVIAAAAIAAIVAVAVQAGRPRPLAAGTHAARAQDARLAGIGTAHGSSLRCVDITLSASNPAYDRVHIDHHPGCPRFQGDVPTPPSRRSLSPGALASQTQTSPARPVPAPAAPRAP